MVKLSSIFNSKKTPASLIILILIFIVLELFTRIFFRPQIIPEHIYTKYSPKYDYGYDKKEPLFYKKNNKLILYPTPYLDFWKQEMPLTKEEDEFRIFTMGSSVSRGDYNSNYSYYLEQYLNSNIAAKKVKVINFSATGIGSSRILLIFKKLLQYQPDLVLFHLHGSNEFEDERDMKEAQKLKSSYEGFIRKSWFFCVLKKYLDENLLNKFKPKEEIDQETYARWFVSGKREEWRNTLTKNTNEIVRIAKQNKIPIIFVNRVFHVDSLSCYEDKETIELNNVTKNIIQKNVYIIDTPNLFLSFFGTPSNKDSIFIDTVHWKPIAHKFIAQKIIEILRNNNMMENPPSLAKLETNNIFKVK